MRVLLRVSLLVFIVLAPGCARQHPLVMNIDQQPVPANTDGRGYSLERVERVILTACRNKGWSASPVATGKIEASITVRSRHHAKIAIDYTTSHYTIHYVDSSGLDYNNGRIHGNYNHWIAKLDAEIKKEFGLRVQRF